MLSKNFRRYLEVYLFRAPKHSIIVQKSKKGRGKKIILKLNIHP
jgi:hypothetical protein